MKTLTKIILIGLILLNITCRSIQEISTFKDLSEEVTDGDLQIVTRDTTVYYVNKFNYTDSTINISGETFKNDVRVSYEGTLFFKDIAYIQTTSSSMFKTLVFVGATGFLVYSGASLLQESSGIETIVKIVYPAGDASCPFIYAWDGSKYNLQGEVFGISLGKALESETSIILPDIEESETELKLKVTNERPETHFFNSIDLFALETDQSKTVYSDNHNSFYAVGSHKEIFRAKDINNIEITDLLLRNDDNYWESDLSSAASKSNYEDVLIIELNKLSQIDSIALIVSAINTEISSVVFSYLQKLLGNEFLNFTKAAETDPEVTEILKETLERSSVKIDIWDGENWEYMDLIYPEANAVKFNKLVRLPLIKDKYGNMRIRLRCLSDVWKIDAVSYDDSPRDNYKKYQVKCLNFESNSGYPLVNIQEKDNYYAKLLPGQFMNLVYEPVHTPKGKKITYAINCRGYLYEWIIDNYPNREDIFKELSTETPKLKLVKAILKDFDTILPIIYSQWKKSKNELVVKTN